MVCSPSETSQSCLWAAVQKANHFCDGLLEFRNESCRLFSFLHLHCGIQEVQRCCYQGWHSGCNCGNHCAVLSVQSLFLPVHSLRHRLATPKPFWISDVCKIDSIPAMNSSRCCFLFYNSHPPWKWWTNKLLDPKCVIATTVIHETKCEERRLPHAT